MVSLGKRILYVVVALVALAAGILGLVGGDTVNGVIFLALAVGWSLVAIFDGRGRLA